MLRILCCFLFIFSSHAFAQHDRLTTVVQKGHSSAVMAADYSPDGKLVATASSDHTIKLWDAATKLEITSFFGHRYTVNHVAFSPDGNYLVSTANDNTARVWDIQSRKLVSVFSGNDYITSAAFSPDSKWIALGGYDWSMGVYDIATGDTLHTMKVDPTKNAGNGAWVNFSPDGKWLAVGEDDRKVRLVRTAKWEITDTLRSEKGMCGGCAAKMAFSPDSRYMAIAVKNGRVALYDMEEASLQHTFLENKRDLHSVDISRDGKLLLAAKHDSIFVWNIKTKKQLAVLSPDVEQINHVTFDPEHNLLVSGNNGQASVWDQSGKQLGAFSGILQQRHKKGLGYDPDNYWERNIARYVDYKNSLSITGDGKHIVNGKIGKKARMWELNSGKVKVDYTGHEKTVLCSVKDEDEGWLLTGGGDGKAILWELNTGEKIRTFAGHSEVVFDVAISHDKQMIATCGWDGFVIVWDINTGKQLSLFRSSSSAIKVAILSLITPIHIPYKHKKP